MKENALSMSPFSGMATNIDPSDLPSGAAQFQENAQSLITGELSGRGGNIKAAFDNGQSPSSGGVGMPDGHGGYQSGEDVIAIFNCHRPAGDAILFETADGWLHVGRGAAAMTALTTTKTGAPTIATDLNATIPLCMVKDRRQNVYGFNGLQRGFRWDTMTAAVEQIGITAPVAAPTIGVSGGGGASAGDYYCSYRYYDDTLPVPNYSSLSPDTIVTAAVGDLIGWSNLSSTTEPRVVGVEFWRSAVGPAAQNKRYRVGSVLISGIGGGFGDTTSDATMIAAAAADPDTSLFITEPNGALSARRFGVPPNFKSVAFMFQDRMWLCVDAVYSDGTASITSGSTAIHGSGTTWTADMVGRYFYMNALVAPLVISAYVSATHLTASTAATANSTFQTYSIRPDPAYRNQLIYSEQDEPESMPISQNTITIQQSGGNDEDEMRGGMPFGAVAYILYDRHIYTVSSYQQPVIDASVALLANRGACNNRCWDIHEGVAYLLDAAGPYTMTPGGSVEPIGAAIQNYFRDNVDLSKAATFHVTCDPALEVVRFFVVFTADSGYRPKRAFVYHLRTKNWWLEKYHVTMGDSGRTEINSKLRAIAGGEAESIYLMDEGRTDVCPAEYRGTATSGTATTLVDSAATFGLEVVGAPVSIIAGTGKGQTSIITARTGTQLTVASWSIATPDSTSIYLIGAVEFDYLSKTLGVEENEEWKLRGVTVDFEPTSAAALLDVRRYWNKDTSPENNVIAETFPQTMNPPVTSAAGDPSHVIDMRLNRGVAGNSAGRGFCAFSGRRNERFEAKQEVTIRLHGFQGDEQIVIYDAEVMGGQK